MVVNVYLRGGLGNQIFMILAGFAHSLKYNLDFKIISYSNTTVDTKATTYWNNILSYFGTFLDDNSKADQNAYSLYTEPCFDYSPIPEKLSNDTTMTLFGFFQSEKYFKEYYDTIAEKMQLTQQLSVIKQEHHKILKKKSIAVHFRIGDYKYLQGYHCIKKPEYYIHAIKELERDLKGRGENLSDYQILYFSQSQDGEIIDEFLKIFSYIFDDKYNFIKVPDSIPDWKQLLIMANCDHFIIANSSYSWFGAYFSENPSKLVYYPAVWFGPVLFKKNNIKDLCPPSWKQINA